MQQQTICKILLAGLFAGVCPIAGARQTPAPPKIPLPPLQKRVDYNNPPRTYHALRLDKRAVFVEQSLQTQAPALARQALTRLRENLRATLRALPESARPPLETIPLFLMYGPKATEGGRDNGLEYFQRNAPEHDKSLDPRWKNSIVVYSAENYIRLSDLWALKAFAHEFAHAYQLTQWPEDQPDIFGAWNNAMQRGLYCNVKDDRGRSIARAYATVNPLEYFAELSCVYFVGCNYQPFNRAELQTYDPVGFAMLEGMWKIKPEPH